MGYAPEEFAYATNEIIVIQKELERIGRELADLLLSDVPADEEWCENDHAAMDKITFRLKREHAEFLDFFEDKELMQRVRVECESSALKQMGHTLFSVPELNEEHIRNRLGKQSNLVLIQWEIEELNKYKRRLETKPSIAPGNNVVDNGRYGHVPHIAEIERVTKAIDAREEYIEAQVLVASLLEDADVNGKSLQTVKDEITTTTSAQLHELQEQCRITWGKVLLSFWEWGMALGELAKPSYWKRKPIVSRQRE